MILLRNLVVFLLLAAAALAAFVYSGAYDATANQAPSQLEEWLLTTLRERSLARRAAGPPPPSLDLADEALAWRGAALYRTHCALCHGAPAVAPAPLAVGLHPVPPSLDSPAVQDAGDGELYRAIESGIKLTGMPAFGHALSDEETWALVAFLRRLPTLSPQQYAAWAAE